jgi:hypothetical protein
MTGAAMEAFEPIAMQYPLAFETGAGPEYLQPAYAYPEHLAGYGPAADYPE